jgi:hypothetical protein
VERGDKLAGVDFLRCFCFFSCISISYDESCIPKTKSVVHADSSSVLYNVVVSLNFTKRYERMLSFALKVSSYIITMFVSDVHCSSCDEVIAVQCQLGHAFVVMAHGLRSCSRSRSLALEASSSGLAGDRMVLSSPWVCLSSPPKNRVVSFLEVPHDSRLELGS